MIVFIGYDAREHVAFAVAKYSMARRSTIPLDIRPIANDLLPERLRRPIVTRPDGSRWCPISRAPVTTDHANARFAIPFLVNAEDSDWVLFTDGDVLCLGDLREVIEAADSKYAVQVVKHHMSEVPATKKESDPQVPYPRKNWSSVTLWNLRHPGTRSFREEYCRWWPGRALHAFEWLDDDAIGPLPPEWNVLIGIQPTHPGVRLMHYTLGGPWLQGRQRFDLYADRLWQEEHDQWTSGR